MAEPIVPQPTNAMVVSSHVGRATGAALAGAGACDATLAGA